MLLVDTFLLYRDEHGVKQRIAPDLLLMPFRFPPPSAYNLDHEPPPLTVVAVTSPHSHMADLEQKNEFFMQLGIPTYLVIDAITPRGQLRPHIQLHLWRLLDGQMHAVEPDADGTLLLPEMGFRVSAHGQQIQFVDAATGAVARSSSELRAALEQERQERLREQRARRQAEAEIERLRQELERFRTRGSNES